MFQMIFVKYTIFMYNSDIMKPISGDKKINAHTRMHTHMCVWGGFKKITKKEALKNFPCLVIFGKVCQTENF